MTPIALADPSGLSASAAPHDGPRGLCVLGSTGSIGTQTLDVVRLFPDRYRVRALCAGRNWKLLAEQARAHRPEVAVLCCPEDGGAERLRAALADTDVRVEAGAKAMVEAARRADCEVVMAAVVGSAGLRPVLAALEEGKTVALANKEVLVVAGALVTETALRHGARLVPVDSEHSALFQCLVGEPHGAVEELILTASGGPFRERERGTFEAITPDEALQHPNWSMGAKITIDSATLMNKGLEVIEAHWLFGLPADRIRVLVHPQSIIHSLVTFQDGSAKAQLGVPDMKVPIQYALSFPDRWPADHPRVDWHALRTLDFEPPDTDAFPCLALAFRALREGGTAPAVLNAANEVAVARFLQREVGFMDIPRLVEKALDKVGSGPAEAPRLDALEAADRAARQVAAEAK